MSFGEIFLIGMIAVLLFGKDLPQVGKKFGKTYAELKRSYDAFQREVRSVVNEATDMSEPVKPTKKVVSSEDGDRIESVAPKFEPPSRD
ncbi:MAG: twin-arginine translocase TatA/TatE family subunit [Planctomycetia bacterium]|nr:twin-arginine translocase TatA/TatE family subunit [Planctomycetia bacterium]